MKENSLVSSESGHAAAKALLGVVFALGLALPGTVVYAQSCGCSGSACGGCTIQVSGSNCSCSPACDPDCIIFSSGECTTSWECP